MRYVGQGYEVEVPLRTGRRRPTRSRALPRDFDRAYRAIFGLAFDDRAVEIVAWKVEVHGPIPGADRSYRLNTRGAPPRALRGHRRAYFPDAGGLCELRRLRPLRACYRGTTIEGPALIEERESTCVLGAGDRAIVDERLNLVIDVEELRA